MDTDTYKSRMPDKEEGRQQRDASISQGTPKIDSISPDDTRD